jgi:hypothetical protein
MDEFGSAEKVLQVVHRAMLTAARTQFDKHPVHPQDRIASANYMHDGLGGIAFSFESQLVDKDVHKP